MQAVLSNKGELVIPTNLLARYGLRAGATVVLEPREGEIALRPVDARARAARLVKGPNGTLLLEAPPGAPPMTTETVKQLLEDFPCVGGCWT